METQNIFICNTIPPRYDNFFTINNRYNFTSQDPTGQHAYFFADDGKLIWVYNYQRYFISIEQHRTIQITKLLK